MGTRGVARSAPTTADFCIVGRRSKFNAEAAAECVKHLRLGVPRKTAAALAGWSPRAMDNYLHDGKAAREEGRFADPKARFVADVMIAEAQCKRGALGIIWKAANGSPAVLDADGNVVTAEVVPQWQAAAWLLERRFPNDFGPRRFTAGHVEEVEVKAGISDERLMEGVADARQRHLRVVPGPSRNGEGDKAG